jgi:hypothetical protein
MRSRFLAWTAVLAAVFLCACANVPKQSFNAAVNKHVKTIGLVAPKKPEAIEVVIVQHPGFQFGLLGASIAAADMSSKKGKYNAAVGEAGFDYAAALCERLGHHLRSAGYQVKTVDAPREDADEYIKSYPEAGVDAYLDVCFLSFGYVAATQATDYKPTVVTSARLVDAKSNEILYTDTLSSGPLNAGPYVDVGTDARFAYRDFDRLVGQAKPSIEGFRVALDRIAERLAKHLAPAADPAGPVSR